MSEVERARLFVSKEPPAWSGKGGHNQTFKVACRLVNQFNLKRSDVWQLLCEYNERCRPRWSADELKHKLEDAYKSRGKRKLKPDQRESSLELPAWATCGESSDPLPAFSHKPSRQSIRPGTFEQLLQIAKLRGIRPGALLIAQHRGVLVFGRSFDYEVWGVTDQSQNVLEYRRIDGLPFPAYGKLDERKSHSIRHSKKTWPVGILEAKDSPCIALVEGLPDFLACHDVVLRETAYPVCAPVAMMSASPGIKAEALHYFRGKTVRIFPHVDESGAGYVGARKWQQQIESVGAIKVDIFDFTKVEKIAGVTCHDLNDFLRVCDDSLLNRFPCLNSILPRPPHANS